MTAAPEAWTSFALLAVVLAVAAYTDAKSGLVYNKLTYPAILAGILLHAGFGGYQNGIEGLVASGGQASLVAFVAFIGGLFVFGLIGLGGGDVKLITAIGAITASFNCLLWACFYGLALTFAGALVMMIVTGQTKPVLTRVAAAAFGRVAGGGTNVQAASTGEEADSQTSGGGQKASADADANASDAKNRFPVAVTLAIGALIAAAEYTLRLLELPWTWPSVP